MSGVTQRWPNRMGFDFRAYLNPRNNSLRTYIRKSPYKIGCR